MDWEKSEFIVEFDCGNDETEVKEKIVRCRDCYFQDEFKYCERLSFKVGDYGFCAWGSRALGETNDD